MATALPSEILALMNSTITVKSETSVDLYGKRSYTVRGDYKCAVVDKTRKVYSREGRDDVSSITFYVDSDDIKATDQIIYLGNEYKIVVITTWRDGYNQVWGQEIGVQ